MATKNKTSGARGTTGTSARAYVEAACEYVDKNFQNDISVTDIAAHVAIDRTYLFKLFRSSKGISPSRYLRLVRLEYARSLIAKGQTPISEVPTMSGFRTRSRFTELFKAEFGVSPKEYAKTVKNQ